MSRFRDRPTSDILVLLIAAVISTYVLVSLALTIVLLFINPKSQPLAEAARNIADIINTLIGLLAGFLAGKSGIVRNGNGKPKDEDPPSPPE